MARRTAEQARETRERILMSAVAAFSQMGFSQPSLERIAADAGVTRGSIYGHFRGKRDLLDAVCNLIDWPALDEHDTAGDAGPRDAIAQLRHTVRGWMTDIDRNPVKRSVLDILLHKTEWTEENAALLARVHRSSNEAARRIHQLLNEATAQGDLRLPLSTQTASTTLQAALMGIISTCMRTSTTGSLADRGDWLITSLLATSSVHRL